MPCFINGRREDFLDARKDWPLEKFSLEDLRQYIRYKDSDFHENIWKDPKESLAAAKELIRLKAFCLKMDIVNYNPHLQEIGPIRRWIAQLPKEMQEKAPVFKEILSLLESEEAALIREGLEKSVPNS